MSNWKYRQQMILSLIVFLCIHQKKLFDLCCNCCDLHKSKCYHLDTGTLLLADLFCSKRQYDLEDFNFIHLSTHLLFSTSTLSFESTFVKLYFEQRKMDKNFILIL